MRNSIFSKKIPVTKCVSKKIIRLINKFDWLIKHWILKLFFLLCFIDFSILYFHWYLIYLNFIICCYMLCVICKNVIICCDYIYVYFTLILVRLKIFYTFVVFLQKLAQILTYCICDRCTRLIIYLIIFIIFNVYIYKYYILSILDHTEEQG